MQKPKVKLKIVIFLEFWVVFTVASFAGNPASSNTNKTWPKSRFPIPCFSRSHVLLINTFLNLTSLNIFNATAVQGRPAGP